MNQRKLLLHQRVEVRQFEEGLRGSWHPGVVVGVSDLCRRVEYDELLSETGDSKLIESIPVTEAIEGLHRRRHVSSTYRGRIRPPPSLLQVNSDEKLGFGVCVDAWFEDAWWEGVLFDCDDDANERSVFFPDEGDERKFSVTQLRVAREWDEFLGVWKDRGIWMLVQLARDFEGDVPLCKFIKKVWSSMRLNYGFRKMISEWPCGVRSVWSRYFMDVVYEIAVKSSRRDLRYLKILSYIVGKKGNKSKDSQQMKLNSYLCDSLVQVRNRKIVSYKVRKKGNKLKNSQHSKLNSHLRDPLLKVRNQNEFKVTRSSQKGDKLNSHLYDSLGKVRNHNEFKVTRSSQKGDKLNSHLHDPLGKVRNQNEFKVTRSSQKGEENSPYGTCNKKKQSSGSKSENEKQSITNTADQNGFKYNNLCREKQMTTGPSFIEHNTVGKGVHNQIANDDSGFHKVGKFISLPTQKKPGGVDFKVEKLNFLPVCEREQDKLHVDSSREEQINTHGLHNVLNYKLVKRRRNLTKRNFNKKLAMVFSECLEKQKDKKLSLVVVHKRKKRSIMKKRKLMKSQRINSKVKSPAKVEEQGLYAVQRGDDLFSNRCCPTLPIEKYGKSFRLKNMVSYPRKREMKQGFRGCQRDTICSVCHYGGDLIFCDHCPSAYHLSCLDLKDFPGRNWFCPSCCCGLCGLGDSNDVNQQFTNICMQCTRRYHMTCLSQAGSYPSESFCSEACFKLCSQLHRLLGISNPTTVDGLTWTLMRSMKNSCNLRGPSRIDSCIKLSSVLRVIHDCFEPVKEPHTKRDLVRDVVFNSSSKLKRLDFHGFFAMVLHRGDEIVSVATVRIHGLMVAEMPLVATPFQYRRQGMCRLLVHEFEKLLIQLGVERLVLPSILQLQKTWEDSFGFSELLHSQRSELFGYPFLGFQGTKMLQKFVSNSMVTKEISDLVGTSRGFNGKASGISVEHKDEPDSRSRYSGLCYKRKSKRRIAGKENMINSCNGSSQRYGYVYKRRRILCSRD